MEIMGGNSCIKDKRKAGRMIQWCERIDNHKTCHENDWLCYNTLRTDLTVYDLAKYMAQ